MANRIDVLIIFAHFMSLVSEYVAKLQLSRPKRRRKHNLIQTTGDEKRNKYFFYE